MTESVVKFTAFFLVTAVIWLIMAGSVMLLWNGLSTTLNLPRLSYTESFAIYALCRILLDPSNAA